MDISIHHQMLVQGLKNLTPEELETFKLYLPDCLPRGLLEEADHTIVTDLLVSSHGPYEAWVLSLRIWKMMGLTELGEPARKDERKKYQERMREKFQFMRNRNSRPEEHELFQHQFTQLLLLQVYRYKEQKHHELLVQGWEHAEVMEERGKPIEVSALFDPDQKTGIQPHTVVLQGAAGIGKTTLAIKVMLDWAEGKLYQERFDYVFYLTCRELNPLEKREISFADLIGNIWTGPLASMTEIMSKPKRLLFIFDGLDELKFPCNELKYNLCRDWKQQRPVPILLSSLLRKTLLPEASLLLTTRLTALEKFIPLLNNPRHIEIWGFSVKQRLEYFCNFFRDEHLGKKAFSLVEDNDMLLTMCSVPLMSWIVCTCLKQQEERGQDPIQTLKTTTALYMCYINLIIPGDKNFILQHMRGLCRLAAEGIWERKLLFEKEDLRRHNLEAADVSALLDMNIFQKDNEYENCYSFIHLSFQEFFAAMFYLMSTDKEGEKSPDSFIPDVKKLLEECSQHDASFVVLVVRFLFGFLNTQTARELERKFSCQMSLEIKSQLLQWIEGEVIKNHGKSLYFKTIFPECYSHLYETQDAEFVTQALVTIQEIEVSIRYQYEALIAIFCIKHCPGARRILFSGFGFIFDLCAGICEDLSSVVNKNQNLKELQLSYIRFADSCMKNLFVELRNPICKLEKLILEDIALTYSDCHSLCSALSINESLKYLHLRDIVFEDDGMKLHCEILRKNNCQLETLRITHSGIFGVCVPSFFFALCIYESLKTLDLSFTHLEEGEVKLLCNVLTNQECKLQTLSLAGYDLSGTGSQNLFSALSNNESLKDLDLSRNSLEEDEIKLLCQILENQHCKLEKLSLAWCSLTPMCSQNLFSSLSRNESLKDLDLSQNYFEEGGIKYLCMALENQNCKLEKLSMQSCKFDPTCSQKLLSAISRNEGLKYLDLSHNVIERYSVILLCKALENQNCKLEKLSLEWCHLTPASSQNLFSSLSNNSSLKELDLSQNSFDEWGINLLCQTLENQKCKLENLSLWYCKLTPTCSQNLFSALSRNESLKNLDLSGNSFEEGEIKLLCKVLENQNCKLEKLSLRYCELTSTCSQNLFSAISRNESLKNLDLSGNSFEEGEIKLLCKVLENQNCKLEKLSLQYCKLTHTCSQTLFSALSTNEILKDLDLSGNSFEERKMKLQFSSLPHRTHKLDRSLAWCSLTPMCSQNLFSSLSRNESLKDLDLSQHYFEEGGIKYLCKALENQNCNVRSCKLAPTCSQKLLSAFSHNESLKYLDLSHNFIEEGSMKLLCKALENQNCKLEKLSLEWCHLSPASSQNLLSSLSKNSSLKELDLSQISFDDWGINLLCKTLENQKCKLEKLSLAVCHLTPTFSKNLFCALRSNESLTDLDLSQNFFKEGEITFLCKILENQSCKLEKLSLRYCKLTPTCSQNVFSALSRNESLKNLDLSGNSFEEGEIKLLCKVLENQNCKLEKLSLAWCSLTPMCSQNLFSSLSRNESLKDLDLSQHYFEEGGIKYLCKALENQNCKLEKLSAQSCKLAPACSQKLLSAFTHNESLKYLDLSQNFIEEGSMKLLCKALENQNCKLEKLSLEWCHLTPASSQNLFSSLSNNSSLKELDLSKNSFDEREINLLCKTLENQKCKLKKLSLAVCHLTPTFSKNLFCALRSNESLTDLDLSQNFFKEGEITFLCKILENQNCKLEKLSLQYCELTPICSQNVFSALSRNESLKNLDLSGNSFEEGEIKLLCKVLENQNCKLEKLSLQYCELTPTCSQNVFSALNRNESLKNLDLSGNSFEEGEIKLLCKVLENQNCKLEKLSLRYCKLTPTCCQNLFSALSSNKSQNDLDLSGNSFEERKMELQFSSLAHQTHKLGKRKSIQIILEDDVKEEEHHTSPQEHLGFNLGEIAPQTKIKRTSSLSPFDPLKDEQLEVERCHSEFLGPNGTVKLELIDKNRNVYRVHLPMAGFYHWPDTGLGFSVRSEVTVDIEFGTWNQHLNWTQKQNYMIAGPLFHIRVDPGVVTSMHLPHFVYLEGGNFDVSLFKIAHFKKEGMVLENPTRVESSYAILENPNFSYMGVLLRIVDSNFKFPIRSTTLLYCQLRAEDITFHLYLIPSDCTIRKAIDKEEKKFHFFRLHKPSPVTPLFIGSRFLVSGSKHLEIRPTELELCYSSAGECQIFSEIYSSKMKEKISLDLRHTGGTVVWETLVRSGDLELALGYTPGSSALTGCHFVDQHRDQIISRVTSVDTILARLYNKPLSIEEYENIRAEKTNSDKMRQLFGFITSWDRNYKDYFYEVLKDIHPHLMNEIQNT